MGNRSNLCLIFGSLQLVMTSITPHCLSMIALNLLFFSWGVALSILYPVLERLFGGLMQGLEFIPQLHGGDTILSAKLVSGQERLIMPEAQSVATTPA